MGIARLPGTACETYSGVYVDVARTPFFVFLFHRSVQSDMADRNTTAMSGALLGLEAVCFVFDVCLHNETMANGVITETVVCPGKHERQDALVWWC